jgi:hypothetical protein
MYLENLLADPGGITLADTPIDLTKIKIPSFILSTREALEKVAGLPPTRFSLSCGAQP